MLYRYGDARARHGKVRNIERRLRFEPDTKVFLEGEIDYTFDDGSVKRVHYERIGNQTAYMTSGLYGGSPDGTIWQGDYVGESVVQGDRFDLADPAVRMRLRGLDEHHCRIRCDGEETTGILQPLEPDAYEACVRGETGWSLL